jgi:hypothetical protein
MTFINWSDPDEMLTLLTEYVSDELSQSAHDRSRAELLANLLDEVTTLEDDFSALSPDASIAALRAIYETQPAELLSDPVLVHVEACIEELTRIHAGVRSPTR